MVQAPFTLYKSLIDNIEKEIKHAKKGRKARIVAKVNALVEPQIIQALYKASAAGVKIQLIVRGTCCLRPGLAKVSENIEVRSIIGRFLEHSRVYWFHNNGEGKVFCSSADWMGRNFFRRIEVCWQIEQTAMRDRIINDLKQYLKDTQQAWILQTDGSYIPAKSKDCTTYSAQETILHQLAVMQ
ncbi:MAG: phospholipase D-like domain-containing protein [Gammaproteobacteria bacterium]|nr:phospholipase D-like domain-containing protein [Gammaproteobacteria bacterium]